jgi:SAM-dependent methyltransferase
VFFKLLGVNDLTVLDCSSDEKADLIVDLNYQVPSALLNRFDLIIDGGTLEHVFDVKQALANIVSMLKPRGRVIRFSPANNYANHGFYQISPTLFLDYYNANGFANLRGFLADHDKYPIHSSPWDLFELDPGSDAGFTSHSTRFLELIFLAEKTLQSTSDRVPLQTSYARLYAGSAHPATGNRLEDRAKAIMSRTFSAEARR